ncbi:coiled-coil domain-containing protein 177 [Chanos chanos]|uniref:Coiled-coil domain-containing protein 177 n=1 Tax=Chanos chanos TaxID=29144 RepID=A0A6J2V778_CHACN|nr:coiled-coil domain-containing protein 177-like [Chanos chanos]
MEKIRTISPVLHLDLNNFDSPEAETCRYVLTSPRSLESCARLGVKPVDLLFKSLSEFIEENEDLPLEALTILYEAHEKKRRERLRLCREERERIIQDGRSIKSSSKQFLALETVLEQASESQCSDSKFKHNSEGIRKEKNQSVGELNCQQSTPSLSEKFREQCTRMSTQRAPDSRQHCQSSFSLGDLRQSPATERLLRELTQEIRRKRCITVPEKDCKIAALMLVKHEEEQDRLTQSHVEEQQREEARRQEEERRACAERRRRKELLGRIRRWYEDVEARRRRRELEAAMLIEQRRQKTQLQEERWRRQSEMQMAQRREKIELVRREVEERKHYQETLLKDKERKEQAQLEKDLKLSQGKEQQAKRSKEILERREKRRLQQENQREKLRHLLLKRKVEEEAEAEKAVRRGALEWKLCRSMENHAQLVQARLQELRERSVREEEQIRKAQQRARWQKLEQQEQKQALVQLSQQRSEQALQHVQTQQCRRAEQVKQWNQEKTLSHRQLRDRAKKKEDAEWEQRRNAAALKERRREQLQKEREEAQERSRKVARASCNLRERVREQTHGRTFDQMALEAELTAHFGRLKIWQ